MSKVSTKSARQAGLSPDVVAELRASAAMTDDQIDLTDPDSPEITDWSGAVRGRFYRPVKKQKTLRIDADVLAYFEAQGPGYLSRMNAVLREAMLRDLRAAPRPARGTRVGEEG
jgi:uncharacterized protein (DUF4415 family)